MANFSGWQLQTSNKNLLINPRFRINQRRQSEYKFAKSRQYAVDGWRSFSSSGTLTVYNDHVTYKGNGGSILCPLEDYSELAGKTVTFSALAKSENGTMYFGLSESGSAQLTGSVTTSIGGDYDIYTFTTTLSNNLSSLGLRFGIMSNQPEETIGYVKAVKLELGSISTLALDLMQPYTPQDYQRELRECQRYFYRLAAFWKYFVTGRARSTTEAVFAFKLPVPMRISPSIVAENINLVRLFRTNNAQITPTAVEASQMDVNSENVVITFTASGLNSGEILTLYFNAEGYICPIFYFSAEL